MLQKTWILVSILQLNKLFFPPGISFLTLNGENETKRVIMFMRHTRCTHFEFQAREGPQGPPVLSPWPCSQGSSYHQPCRLTVCLAGCSVTLVAHMDTPRVPCLLSRHTIISCSGASLMPLRQELSQDSCGIRLGNAEVWEHMLHEGNLDPEPLGVNRYILLSSSDCMDCSEMQ